MHQYYLEYLNEDKKIIHQYLGEYLAKNVFEVTNIEILNAIKYHTSGKENMSLLEKLIYVSDKVEPRRDYPSRNELFETCCKDFDKGFIATLKHNKDYLESKKIKVSNKDTINCFNYYLK
jgi:nicotinate-nucleotide adenylyltransferase